MPRNTELLVREKAELYARLTGRENPLMYLSRPGDGTVRYVFEGRTCLGAAEAVAYMDALLAEVSEKRN